MLHRTSAAGPEENATRGNSRRALLLDPHDLRGFPRGLLAVSGVFDELAGDCIVDEHRFSPDVGHAATLPVEGLDKGARHRGLRVSAPPADELAPVGFLGMGERVPDQLQLAPVERLIARAAQKLETLEDKI